MLFDVFSESEQALIIVIDLLHDFVVYFSQSPFNLVNMLTNLILVLSEHLKIALSFLKSFVVLFMLTSAISELFGDLILEHSKHRISYFETFVVLLVSSLYTLFYIIAPVF